MYKSHRLQSILRFSAVALLLSGAAVALYAEEPDTRMGQDKRGDLVTPATQGLYSKPVWKKAGRGTYVGGYVDFEYRSRQNAKQKFESIRLVPFIYGDIAPGLRFAAEIEFEHGGATSNGAGDAKVEFAVLDYDLWEEKIGARAGIVLVPLGKFNLMHDSPINDLNDRPLVSRYILPSTFYEPGAGFFGEFYPGGPTKLDYQIYVTQGFNGGATGVDKISRSGGVRSARSATNGSGDNNENVALTGRLAVSPFLGSDIGASFHTGTWDTAGSNALNIFALDWAYHWRFLEFQGEYGNAYVEKNAVTDASVPSHMQGYYAQINAHFLQDWVRAGSVFTGVVRWDDIDLDLEQPATTFDTNSSQSLTFGLNFRPVEQTVFKVDYQINFEDYASGRGAGNNAIIVGFATYF